jgi:hypothetical protein
VNTHSTIPSDVADLCEQMVYSFVFLSQFIHMDEKALIGFASYTLHIARVSVSVHRELCLHEVLSEGMQTVETV